MSRWSDKMYLKKRGMVGQKQTSSTLKKAGGHVTDGDQAFPPTLRPALNPLSIIMGMVSRCIETAIFSLWWVWWPASVNLEMMSDIFRIFFSGFYEAFLTLSELRRDLSI